MNHTTPPCTPVVQSFRLAPTVRRRLNRLRLNIDILGVTSVRLVLPLVQNPVGHTVLDIYNIAAWITILTVDNTRIPEAGTTRIQQRASWRFAFRYIPVLALMLSVLTLGFHQPVFPKEVLPGKMVFMTIGSYVDEMLFRNTLQPKLRQLGFPLWTAIGIQSTLYALAILLAHASLPIVMSFFTLGCINGWIVYRFRSLWAAFVFGLIWNLLWLG
ncbi:CPBP family intramembrane metalloprotease [Alicyclobacillus curvatus]|nr:CPBP family intramembrane metalloprotease [Alicyclobacillus curvatus]